MPRCRRCWPGGSGSAAGIIDSQGVKTAEGGDRSGKLRSVLEPERVPLETEVVERKSKGSEVLHRRWVVERTFSWLNRCRRLAENIERTIATSLAWLRLAVIRVQARRLAGEIAGALAPAWF